jgi:hypothetical protein
MSRTYGEPSSTWLVPIPVLGRYCKHSAWLVPVLGRYGMHSAWLVPVLRSRYAKRSAWLVSVLRSRYGNLRVFLQDPKKNSLSHFTSYEPYDFAFCGGV